MAERRLKKLELENVNIRFSNFAGREDNYGHNYRTVNVDIPLELEDELEEAGWPLKHYKVRNEDEIPQGYLKVRVSFMYEDKAPDIFLSTASGRKMKVKESTVHKLDKYTLKDIDMELESSYSRDKTTGQWRETPTIYLTTMFATLIESRLAAKHGLYDEDPEEVPWDEE